MQQIQFKLLFWSFFFIINGRLFAQIPPDEALFLKPQDPEQSAVFLISVGLGETIEARFGHTILRIVDYKDGREFNLNWGMFDFSDPKLPLDFFAGKLRYWVGNISMKRIIDGYRFYEKRPVYIQEIILTKKQKERLFNLLEENLTPEKKYFWYHHFYNNCATIPVNLLNQVLGDKIKQNLSHQHTGKTFRSYVLQNLNEPPLCAFALDILLNNLVDNPISKWDELFYPIKVMEYLHEIPAYNDHDLVLPQTLLSAPVTLVSMPEAETTNSRCGHLCFLLLGLAIFLLHCLTTYFEFRFSKVAAKIVCSYLLFFSLFSTLFGTVMSASWMFSAHLDTHHNVNLLFFWPVDVVFVFYSFFELFGRKIKSLQKAIGFLAFTHIVVIVLACGLYAVSYWAQDISRVLFYIVPVEVCVMGCFLRRML